MTFRGLVVLAALASLTACIDGSKSDESVVVAAPLPNPPDELVQRLSLDSSFYKQYLDLDGYPIVASDSVNPYALYEARWIVRKMLAARSDLLSSLSSTNTRLAIMSINEFTTDIPEHADLLPKDYWDRRARGLGATPARPVVSTGEENLLQYRGDPYSTENILIHEFAHVVEQHGMNNLDPTFSATLSSIFASAMDEGLWENTYAATNTAEYFAEGTQSWFGSNRQNDNEHNEVNTRAELIDYDPRLASLLAQVYGDNDWVYLGPTIRTTEVEHLANFNVATSPEFVWPERLANVDISSPPDITAGFITLPNLLNEDWAATSSPTFNEGASKLVFRNNTGVELDVYWIDFSGVHQFLIRIGTGDTPIDTFGGHLFVLTDLSGITVGQFRASSQDSIAEIN